MAQCVIAGCNNPANKFLGVRLRRPQSATRKRGSAIWAHETGAFICDQHAVQGIRLTLVAEPTQTGHVETETSGVGTQPIQNSMLIKKPAN